MQALTFWKTVTMDQVNLLERLFALLDQHRIRYCVIGGQAVNAYVEPLVSLDLDLVVSVEQIEAAERLLADAFTVKSFPHSLNLSLPGSDLRVPIQTDPRYADFVDRATSRPVLGLTLPVASVEDVLRGKVWAALDPARRASKRQKDLADIARLIEAYPQHRSLVPDTLLARLV
ncbi:MAG: nucleotidyl transferase AbiEii/AbiGii toxin family protein [Anaerolineae bacterium]|nr:nucleotidyl transferase AbiEii/AbiGii toxin family protein [Anaerolineae bacterium]